MSSSNFNILDSNQGNNSKCTQLHASCSFSIPEFRDLALLEALACLDGSTIWFPERASRISGWESRKHASSRADANEDSEPQKSTPSV
jgi:hypothetical protein